ncbi:MAG: hypothetical protein AAF958_15385 [Planctomycetota bacterium]
MDRLGAWIASPDRPIQRGNQSSLAYRNFAAQVSGQPAGRPAGGLPKSPGLGN